MAQKQPSAAGENDIARLTKKISARRKDSQKPDADPALRALRKRLKRAQRRVRAMAMRKARASGKTAEAKPAAAAAAS